MSILHWLDIDYGLARLSCERHKFLASSQLVGMLEHTLLGRACFHKNKLLCLGVGRHCLGRFWRFASFRECRRWRVDVNSASVTLSWPAVIRSKREVKVLEGGTKRRHGDRRPIIHFNNPLHLLYRNL